MSTTLKEIIVGISAGMVVGSILIAGIFWIAKAAPLPEFQSDSAQEASFAPGAMPAATPLPNFLPNPALTLPKATSKAKPPLVTSRLDEQKQAQLHAASLSFVAPDFYSSKTVGEQINGKGYGHPSNICGPLAIAILQKGGILSEEIIPYEFWLLNPDIYANQVKLRAAFPEERFENLRVKTSLNRIDWASFPLLPGDFLYLYSGSRGNFEHMLAVTRVDEERRAYTVTNHATEEDGFIITEALLYDPQNPGEGLFYEWTAREKAVLGSTGFGGFHLWRLRER